MLEDLAYAYAQSSAVTTTSINVAFIATGGVIGGLTDTSTSALPRAPYFAKTGMLLAGFSCFSLIEVQFLVAAMAGGVLWLMAAADFAALALLGFLCARIAAARSRHATGNGSLAILAFIPVANLHLLIKARPADWPPTAADDRHALSGAAGVVLGIVLGFASIVLDKVAEVSTERNVTRAAAAGELDRVYLPELLRSLAASVSTPKTVDEVTTLTSVVASETAVVYTYAPDVGDGRLSDSFPALVTRNSCESPRLRRILRAGGTVTMTYFAPNGGDLLTSVEVTEESCPD